MSQLGSACLGLLVTGTPIASPCSAPGSLHHEPENYPGLGPCDRLTWSRPLRPAPGTPGAPQRPRLVAPASPASRPEAAEGPAESLPEAHTRRRGSPDCGHGDPGPRAGSALRPARWASGLAVGRAATPLRPGLQPYLQTASCLQSLRRRREFGNSGTCEKSGSQGPSLFPPNFHTSPFFMHLSCSSFFLLNK